MQYHPLSTNPSQETSGHFEVCQKTAAYLGVNPCKPNSFGYQFLWAANCLYSSYSLKYPMYRWFSGYFAQPPCITTRPSWLSELAFRLTLSTIQVPTVIIITETTASFFSECLTTVRAFINDINSSRFAILSQSIFNSPCCKSKYWEGMVKSARFGSRFEREIPNFLNIGLSIRRSFFLM